MDADIKSKAVLGASRFAEVWQFNDFWKRSNTFQSILCLVDAAELRWGKGDPALHAMQALRASMLDANLSFFKERMAAPDGIWADDYGWCGIACVEACNYLRANGDAAGAAAYEACGARCWEQMTSTGYDVTNQATPVLHGCGNISPERKRAGGGYGTRNTVTNTNLLLLSLRLYALNRSEQYLDMAIKQFVWFGQWFSTDYPSLDDGPYLRILPGPLGLIHERPMAEASYTEEDLPIWQTGWVWSGDQGLLLTALAELLVSGIRPPGVDLDVYRNAFIALSIGVEALLFGGADRVLREAPFHSAFDHAYAGDYVGGRGVLLRYMSEPVVTRALGRPLQIKGIAATADAVWASRDESNQFASLWNADGDRAFNFQFVKQWGSGDTNITGWELTPADFQGVLQANGLDALTAAIRLGLAE